MALFSSKEKTTAKGAGFGETIGNVTKVLGMILKYAAFIAVVVRILEFAVSELEPYTAKKEAEKEPEKLPQTDVEG